MKRRLPPTLAALLAVALLAAAAVNAAREFAGYPGVDFYHLWGVGRAHAIVGGDPYANTREYSGALNGIAAASPSERLRFVSSMRRLIQPTGTPFFYAAFGASPADYDLAYAIHYGLLFAALIAATGIMARMRGLGAWSGLALGALVFFTFYPFVQDSGQGNVTTFQLLLVVAAILVAGRRLDARWPALGLAYLPVLVLSVAFKPNLALVAGALALHFVATRGLRATRPGIAVGIAALAVAWLAGTAFFGDAGVWTHWYRYTHGMNGGTLLYGLDQQNVSLAMLMAERSGMLGVYGYGALLGAGLALLFGAALTSLGKRVEGAAATLRRLLEDPWFVASAAVLLTFAVTPLMWSYYRMLALVPLSWLAFRDRRWDGATAWALLAYVLMSRPLVLGLFELHLTGVVQLAAVLGWIALVPAMCACLAARARVERAAIGACGA